MKRNKLFLASLLAAVSLFATNAVNALPQSEAAAIKKSISTTSALELAPAAQKLVRDAKKEDRRDVARLVVRTVLVKRPALAVAVVDAVTKEAPETAVDVVSAAVELAPAEAVRIAGVAAKNSPSLADKIAAAVVKSAPQSSTKIAKAVMAANPAATRQIVQSMSEAAPSTQAALEGDATIRTLSAFARLSAESASGSGLGGKITITPNGIVFIHSDEPLVINVDQTLTEARSSALNDLVTKLQQLDARNDLSVSQKSDIANAIVNVSNSIGTDFSTPKSERDQTYSATLNALTQVLDNTPTGTSEADKSAAAKTLLQGIAAVVKDPETTGAQTVTLVNFIGNQIQNAINDAAGNSNISNSELTGAIQLAVTEVKKVVETSGVLDTTALNNATQQIANTLDNQINAYGTP